MPHLPGWQPVQTLYAVANFRWKQVPVVQAPGELHQVYTVRACDSPAAPAYLCGTLWLRWRSCVAPDRLAAACRRTSTQLSYSAGQQVQVGVPDALRSAPVHGSSNVHVCRVGGQACRAQLKPHACSAPHMRPDAEVPPTTHALAEMHCLSPPSTQSLLLPPACIDLHPPLNAYPSIPTLQSPLPHPALTPE